jgi:ABC-type uncharacterized transport system fused permease/ATPase subunit
VGLSLLTTALLLKISAVQSAFSSALSEKNSPEFYAAVWSFVGVILLAAPLFALNEYVDSRIAVEWRAWLARRLIAAYFRDQAYFRLKADPQAVDNPDQRICDDVRSYAASSVVLAVGVLRQLFYCVAFAGLLWSLAPGLVGVLVLYAGFGTWVTAAGFGPRLTALAFEVLQREADLRFELVRVRENAESVAFYGGGAREAGAAGARLGGAVGAARAQVRVQAWLALWQNVYAYATVLVPALLMAPRYFRGDIRFGVISQVSFAFNRIEAALSYVVNHLASLSGLAAETERLDALLGALSSQAGGGGGGGGGGGVRRLEGGEGVAIQGLTLTTPRGEQVLCRDLSLALAPGQSLLVVGPSGAGKSSLLRAAAGLWSAGGGSITAPPRACLFFLPQKPYMPLGSLRQQLTFPDPPEAPGRGLAGDLESSGLERGGGGGGEDAQLQALLATVCLPGLLQRVGGLDAECDWAGVLSLGEQQRVAFLRLLRARPAVAFLDEATSGVDTATEAALYSALRAACACHVSVGHRRELVRHHSHVLRAAGEGRWELHTAAEYEALLLGGAS